MPSRASSWGMVASSYTINGLRESERNGQRLWGERQGEAVTEIVEGHQQAVMAAGAVYWLSPGYQAMECRVPRGPPQRQIASGVDRRQAADIVFRLQTPCSVLERSSLFHGVLGVGRHN